MNENEQKQVAMDWYVNIQRIKEGGREELEYQEALAEARLNMLGIPTDNLKKKTSKEAQL